MEAAESLSMADWKLLTEVRLLGLAESLGFQWGEEKYGEERVGANNRFQEDIKERRDIIFITRN